MNRDRRMNVLRRTAGLLLAAVTAFGGSEAAAEGTPSEVTMHEDKVIEYGDMGGRTVVRSLTDGSGETGFAYCTNPLDPNPPSGSVSTEPIEIISGDYSPADAAKVLYYGYGGPGFDASLFPDEVYSLSSKSSSMISEQIPIHSSTLLNKLFWKFSRGNSSS